MTPPTKNNIMTRFGFYIEPVFSYLDNQHETWSDTIKKKYPIQYFFRDTVYWRVVLFCGIFSDLKHGISRFIRNPYKNIRIEIPRYRASDLYEIINKVNLQIIVTFYSEAKNSMVDWFATDHHRKFYTWLEESANIIMNVLPKMEMEIEKIMSDADAKIGCFTYKEKYKNIDELEKESETIKSTLIKEMIDYKEYFWT